MFLLHYFRYKIRERKDELRMFFKIARKAVRDLFFSRKIVRTKEYVKKGYEEDWEHIPASMKLDAKPGPMRVDDGRIFLWRSIDRRKFLLSEVSSLLRSIRPKNFLEIGSGNGINILALAILCPEITTWRGLELTERGVASAKHFLQFPPMDVLVFLTGRSPESIMEILKTRDIDFVCGDMHHMPFADNSFDCIFTQHAIEQVPHTYAAVFKEARRVSKNAIFLEPFAEAQRRLVNWLYVMYSDYFHASYHEVEKAGFRVLKFEPIISKAKHATGFLFCN